MHSSNTINYWLMISSPKKYYTYKIWHSKHLAKLKNYKQLDLCTWWNSTFHWKQAINFEFLLVDFIYFLQKYYLNFRKFPKACESRDLTCLAESKNCKWLLLTLWYHPGHDTAFLQLILSSYHLQHTIIHIYHVGKIQYNLVTRWDVINRKPELV